MVVTLAPSPRVSTHLASRAGLKIPTFAGGVVLDSSIVDLVAGIVVVSVIILHTSETGPRGAGDVFDGPVVVAGLNFVWHSISRNLLHV